MAQALYYTLAKYVALYGEEEATRLTADDSGEMDGAAFTRAITQVSALMDTYLNKYTLPFAEVPLALEEIASALVREKLHGNFPTETVIADAKNARAWLKDLASGKSVLILPDGEQPPVNEGGGSVEFYAPPRVFTKAKLDHF